MSKEDPTRVGLPPRPFLYTVDQLSVMLAVDEKSLHTSYIYHEGRDIGVKDKHHITARNIAKPDEKPEWRISERELIRWFRFKGFKFYDRGTVTG